jgi:hypothetical protein
MEKEEGGEDTSITYITESASRKGNLIDDIYHLQPQA